MQYAGDISAEESWDRLQNLPGSVLVDVRTRAEWSFVGLVDLSSAGKQPLLVEWQSYPTMAVNRGFVDQVKEAVDSQAPIFCLCRSGARSAAAAAALTAAGFDQAYNIAAGFEGDPDAQGHRGVVNGWKAAALPWRQG